MVFLKDTYIASFVTIYPRTRPNADKMAMLKDVIKKALEELSKFLQTKNRRGPGGWPIG